MRSKRSIAFERQPEFQAIALTQSGLFKNELGKARAVNEVSRSFSRQDFVFIRTNARTVQKRARQGSQSGVGQEFSKPKDYQMPRAINEVSRSKDSRNFKLSRLHRADCSKASETRLARV